MIDCSHGNSNKDYRKQSDVLKNVANQIKNGEKNILGVMLESHLKEGNQKLSNRKDLEYGTSITPQPPIQKFHPKISNLVWHF